MKRLSGPSFGAFLLAGVSFGATLEKLTLDEMIRKSTEIVRGRVISTSPDRRGAILYTKARVQVYERMKGAPSQTVDVMVPGGVMNGMRQSIAGAPELSSGAEYVFFLWTGRNGITQIIGLSQGLLEVKVTVSGEATVNREPIGETLLDAKTHRPVADEPIQTTVARLRNRIRSILVAAKE